ncbi:MAG: MFS transporter [Planctomycetia bacterium]
MNAHPESPAANPAASLARRNAALFVAFRILFNVRFYYPVFMVMFLDFGVTLEQFGILNAVWAAAIVLLEVPSGALADLVGRRRLLVASAGLMVVEMLLLCLVPVPSRWVFPALLLNRIVSGAAEALASGADEALAYDSLQAAGRSAEWPKVLETLMQAGAIVTIATMVAGSLLYDPRPLNMLAVSVGLPPTLTAADTFRLPVWLTLGSALAAVAATLAMREPPREKASADIGLLAPFRETIATGSWILAHPLVLAVIMAGVLCDQPIRQLLVVSSEIYREIAIPEPAFGLVGALSASVSLMAAGPIRRLAIQASPRRNFVVLVAITLAGLVGTALFVPVLGVAFAILLSLTMRMVVFLQSHYLNQLVGSDRRATVLSFRGLAVNVGYGLMSLGFAAAAAGMEAAGVTTTEATDRMPAFRAAVALLPVSFVVLCGLFLGWVSRAVRDRSLLAHDGGFEIASQHAATPPPAVPPP